MGFDSCSELEMIFSSEDFAVTYDNIPVIISPEYAGMFVILLYGYSTLFAFAYAIRHSFIACGLGPLGMWGLNPGTHRTLNRYEK
jgi:hypothetical protein